MMLDLRAIAASTQHAAPFWWAHHDNVFVSAVAAEALQASFPAEAYRRLQRATGPKRHDLTGRMLPPAHELERTTCFPAPWVALSKELHGPDYREAVSKLSSVALDGLLIEVTLWRQSQGGFIDPHCDNEEKVLVHLIYLSDARWSRDDGGCFRLLRSSDIEDVAAEIRPRLGESVVFRRSSTSWHGYKPVATTRWPRLAVQVVFHTAQLNYGSAIT